MADGGPKWVAGFDYPTDGWIHIDVTAEDGAERAAQEVADRGGELDQAYAEALYPELKVIRDGAFRRNATPVVVFVPVKPAPARPLVPVTAFVAPWSIPKRGLTLESVAAMAQEPQPYRLREPLISEIELPAGPALRLHELVIEEKGDDDRQVLTEYLSYYVSPIGYPGGIVEMTVTWSSPGMGAEMAETADEMAASLAVVQVDLKTVRDALPQARLRKR